MSQKDRYVFPAIFDFASDGISIFFPDLPGCLPSADETSEAFKNAREAMALHLYGMEEDHEPIPNPTDIKNIKAEKNQIVTLIEAWMPPYRSEIKKQAVKKTLTIPKWLDDIAKENKINYSHVLQDALKDRLGIERP
ncbi:MAG: type II toxin-antitoxin system HicB family antitoxin [Sporolactobacillus sp.]